MAIVCAAGLNQSSVARLFSVSGTDEDRPLQKIKSLPFLIPGYYVVIIYSGWFCDGLGSQCRGYLAEY